VQTNGTKHNVNNTHITTHLSNETNSNVEKPEMCDSPNNNNDSNNEITLIVQSYLNQTVQPWMQEANSKLKELGEGLDMMASNNVILKQELQKINEKKMTLSTIKLMMKTIK